MAKQTANRQTSPTLPLGTSSNAPQTHQDATEPTQPTTGTPSTNGTPGTAESGINWIPGLKYEDCGKDKEHGIADAIRYYTANNGGRIVEQDGKRRLEGIKIGAVVKGLKAVGITTTWGVVSSSLKLDSQKDDNPPVLTADSMLYVFQLCKETSGGSASLIAAVESAKLVQAAGEKCGGLENFLDLLVKAKGFGM